MRWRLRSVRALLGALASLAVALAGSLPSAAPCAAAGAFDSSIVVNGNRRVEADTIRSYFRLLPGEQVDAAKIDAALKALYATELFQDVRITRSDGHVVVTVVEAGVIDRVAFEGNSRVKDEQLTSEVQSKPRGTFSRAKVQADVQRIIEVYHRAGRYDVRVEPKIIDRSDSRVDLVFQISEGGRTTVRRIDFTGNHAFSATRLKGEIKTTETNLLSFLKNSDVYDADRIEADRDLLRRFYLNRGYADARIVSAAAAFDPALKGFVVTFTVDEGELYRFGAIDLQSSVREVDPATLRGRLKTVSGRVFDASAVEKSADEMTIEMSRRGYPFAQVRPHADRDPSTHTVNLRYLVDQATRAYVERINIRGNSKTREYVIRREFDIAEGDPYNKVLIDRAERRLKNLNFFKTVKIANEPGSAPDRIVINVDVDEQQTGDFSISGGYSTMDGLIAEVSVSERNLFGRGEFAKASFILGQYTKGFDVGFVEPFFLGTRASLGLDVFAKQTSVNSYQSFGSETYGATVKLGTPLSDEIGTEWRYTIYNQRLLLDPALTDCSPANPPPGCYANGEASLPVKQAALNGPAWVSAVGSSFIYNTRDNNKNPHSGMFVEVKQDVAGLGGDVDYFRTTGDVRYYHEVAGDVVGMARAQGGFVTPWGGQQLSVMNSFFGGPQLVRGFAPNGFGPRDLTPGTTMDNVGGSRYFATTAEFQAPVPNLPADFGLKLAFFADAGSVWGYSGPAVFPSFGQSVQVTDSTFIRASVGAGLVWDSPFGALRVDYAIPIRKTSSDVVQPFRFGVGGF